MTAERRYRETLWALIRICRCLVFTWSVIASCICFVAFFAYVCRHVVSVLFVVVWESSPGTYGLMRPGNLAPVLLREIGIYVQ